MATNFPTSLDSLTNPAAGDSLSSPSHAAQHANINDAMEAVQAKVGVDGSAVTGSLDYKVANQGLTLVKTQTIGTSVSSFSITGITGYNNYLMIFDRIVASVNTTMRIDSPDLAGTKWYGNLLLWTTSATPSILSSNPSGNLKLAHIDTVSSAFQITAYNLNNSGYKRFTSSGASGTTGQFIGGGTSTVLTSASQLYFSPDSGTLTGGTVRIYGYNDG